MPTVLPYGLGMRGSGTWEPGQKMDDVRQALLRLYPNGSMPLTAITSMLKSSPTHDVRFSWWTKNFPMQSGPVSGVYTNAALTTAYTAGNNPAGLLLYVKVAEVVAKEFRPGHVAELRAADNMKVSTAGHVMDVVYNGANSYIVLRTIENTVNNNNGPNPAVGKDTIAVIGNAVPEGGVIPNAVNYNPIEMYNYVQQFWTPYEISTIAEDTKLYTNDPLTEEKREKFELHGIELEKAFLFGRRKQDIDPNTGRPIWYTMGVIPMIKEYAPNNVRDYRAETDTRFKGKEWIEAGKLWLDITLEEISRCFQNEMLVLCGSGAMVGLSQLAEALGTISLRTGTISYGIQVKEWIHPTCPPLLLKTHPLLTNTETFRYSMIFIDTRNLQERYMRKTQTTKDVLQQNGGPVASLSKKEGWLTVTGLEYHHPDTFAILDGVGADNTLA